MNIDFSKIKVLIIGDFMLDEYLYGISNRISPEAPVPIVKTVEKKYCAGGSGNVGINVHSLGARPILIGAIGKDKASKELINIFKNNNLICSENISTTTKKRIFINNKQNMRLDNDSSMNDNSIFVQLCKKIDDNIKKCNIIILSDYNKGILSNKLCQYVIKSAKKLNIPVVVDPKKKSLNSYKGSTIITPNLNEAKLISGLNYLSDFIQFFQKQIVRFKIDYVVLKLGKNGMVLIKKDSYKKFDGIKVKNPDVTGAGDTVIAALSLMFSMNNTIDDCVRYSNIAASKVVEKCETASLTMKEFLKL